MIRNHEELVCWQLWRFTSNIRDAIASACRNQAEGFYKFRHSEMRPFFNTAQGSLGEVQDCIQDGDERGFFSSSETQEMSDLCRRAMNANLRFLRSLRRPDP